MASRDAIQMRVEGLEAARAALEAVVRAERAGAQRSLTAIGQQAVTEVRRRAPLLTGRLRRSYTYEVGPGYVEISSNVEYAPHQEFGTRYMDGTPHLRPGIEAVIPKVPLLVAAAMTAGARSVRMPPGLPNRVARIVGAL